MRIAFVIPTLGPGGAERVATLLCGDWVRRKHQVDLIAFGTDPSEPFYTLDPNIAIHRLSEAPDSSGLFVRASANLRRIRRLRSLLHGLRPEIVVAFMTEANVVALIASRALPCPVVISERNQPNQPGLGILRRLARRVTYRQAAAIVMQTEQLAAWARDRFPARVQVIPNPVVVANAKLAAQRGPNARKIVSVGRLVPQKGFDILIKSFASLASKYPQWSMVIHGEGPQRTELTELIEKYHLEDHVALPGLTRDVAGTLSEATIFVLPSRFEGSPNALLEALSAGVPAIATDCPGANADILARGAYGKLVPPGDVPALTEALETMMTMPELRAAYAARGGEAVRDYELAKVSGQWLSLFQSISSTPKAN